MFSRCLDVEYEFTWINTDSLILDSDILNDGD